jgi:DNA repair exonuclease SbcCD ATPase subunit
MENVYIALSVILSIGALFGSIFAAKKLAGGITKEAVMDLRAQAESLESEFSTLLSEEKPLISRAQLDALVSETADFQRGLESQRTLMNELDGRLSETQKSVEVKEREQQEMKSAKEEDEKAVNDLMARYDEYSTQAVALEHKLGESLKSLDAMIADTPMTADQKVVFQELSQALSTASSRLRDLIVDYQSLNERLTNLKGQHADLESEYTKLVEQQLGA